MKKKKASLIVSDKSLKAAYARASYWARKKKKKFPVTIEEFAEFRLKPCKTCGRMIFGTGIGFNLVEKKKDWSLDNLIPTCGVCRLLKPVESFNLIKHCTNTLRRGWRRQPMAAITIQKARLSDGRYLCAVCGSAFNKKDIQIDHIAPVIDISKGYENLDVFATRLFCPESNLQIICKECHSKKTNEENALRRELGKR